MEGAEVTIMAFTYCEATDSAGTPSALTLLYRTPGPRKGLGRAESVT